MNKDLLQQSIELNERMLDHLSKDTFAFAEEIIELKEAAKKKTIGHTASPISEPVITPEQPNVIPPKVEETDLTDLI